MRGLLASNALYFCWMLVPSIVLSATFHQPLFCVDTLAFPFIEARLSRPLAILFRLLWTVLFIALLLGAWNIEPKSYLFYFGMMAYAPTGVLGQALLMAVFLGLFLVIPAPRWGRSKSSRWLFIACGAVLAFKMVSSVILDNETRRAFPFVAAAPSTIKYIVLNATSATARTSHALSTPTFSNFVDRHPTLPNKVVLMMVESWGETAHNLGLIKADLTQRRIEVLESGFTDYDGATLQGEFREMCARFIETSDLTFDHKVGGNCAPHVFRSKNYDVIGLHGYAKGFNARYLIWKNLGFGEAYFEEEMSALKHCPGAFPGVCDTDLINHGMDLLAKREKAFLYLLTLSSHELVDPTMAIPDKRYLSDIPAQSLAQIVARNALSALVAKLDGGDDKTCVVAYVVGDHPPPSLTLTGALDGKRRVPYLVLGFHCPSSPAPAQ